METVKTKSTDALAELVVINNDRYEGYNTAAKETKDQDLKTLFTRFAEQSRAFSQELKTSVPSIGTNRDETKLSGKFYRVWMDVKSALTGKNRKAILSSCETGEDVALKTYDDVLNDPEDISDEQLKLIRRQRDELQQSHDQVRAMRDSA